LPRTPERAYLSSYPLKGEIAGVGLTVNPFFCGARGMPNGISKDTFSRYDENSKLDTLFDYIHEIYEVSQAKCPEQQKICDTRFHKIESRKWINTWAAGVGGVIGGIVAVVFKSIFGG
jgi:hypothetical protein